MLVFERVRDKFWFRPASCSSETTGCGFAVGRKKKTGKQVCDVGKAVIFVG